MAGLGLAAWMTLPAAAQNGKAPAKPAPAAKHKCKPGMVPIPAGTFTMGDDKTTDKSGDVKVAAFCMDRTEVTVTAYAACVKAGGCTPANTGSFCNAGVAGRQNHPINCVDWNQAEAYCQAQGLRLPTEEEWEYAARGTDGRLYPWGNAAPSNQLCWNRSGHSNSTCAVGAYPKDRSPFGLVDMAGNVSEWTSSLYSDSDSNRVFRGGSGRFGHPSDVRSAARDRFDPSVLYGLLGFRCAGSAALP